MPAFQGELAEQHAAPRSEMAVAMGCIPVIRASAGSSKAATTAGGGAGAGQWRDAHALVAPLLWLECTRRARKAAARRRRGREMDRHRAAPSPYGSGRSLRDSTASAARSTLQQATPNGRARPVRALPQLPDSPPEARYSSFSHELCPRHLDTHIPESVHWETASADLRLRVLPARANSFTSAVSTPETGAIPSFRI